MDKRFTTVARCKGRIIGVSRTYALSAEHAVRLHAAQYGGRTDVAVSTAPRADVIWQ